MNLKNLVFIYEIKFFASSSVSKTPITRNVSVQTDPGSDIFGALIIE